MEKSKLLQVIAAIMITSMAVSMLSFSTTTVSATHTQTPTLAVSRVKANTSMVITITVTNNGPDAIDNVRIIIPTTITDATPGVPGVAAVQTLKAGDNVNLGSYSGTDTGAQGVGSDNRVWLKAGTVIMLRAAQLSVGADNVAIVQTNTVVRWTAQPSAIVYENSVLNENLGIKLMHRFFFSTTFDNLDNFVWRSEGDKVVLTTLVSDSSTIRDNVKLVSDTLATKVSGTDNVYTLPENTMVSLLTYAVATIAKDNRLTLQKENFAPLSADNLIDWATREELGILAGYENFLATTVTHTSKGTTSVNDNIQIVNSTGIVENLVFPAGTPVRLENTATAYIFADTQVIRISGENVVVKNLAAATENQPAGWRQSVAGLAIAVPAGNYLEWLTDNAENMIASGSTKSFPISIKTPNITVENTYTIYVRTMSRVNSEATSQDQTVTLTVDGAAPTYTVSALGGSYGVSPTWVKDNAAVTITITALESLRNVDNVRVTERDGTQAADNVQVTMTPLNAENKVWTGTYTTGTSAIRDGVARIYVVGAQMADLVGNKGADNFDVKFVVDRSAPLKPRLTLITGWPTRGANIAATAGKATKTAAWTLENVIFDNVENALAVQAGMTINVRVGTTVYPITTDATGYWTKLITLSQGTQEVGVQIVDKAGNAGLENAENITLDSTKPSVTMISPLNGTIIKDNTPLISLTIADATLGIENMPFAGATVDNSGYMVRLRRDGDNIVIATLLAKNPTTIPRYFNSLTFENQWQLDNALPDNTYNIWVEVGDNLQNENVYFSFTIDTVGPTWTQTQLQAAVTVKDPATSAGLGTTTKKTSWLISGGAKQAGSTVNVYVGSSAATATLKDTAIASTTLNANTGLYDYSLTIELSEGVGQNVYVEEVDTASNTSGLVLLNTYTVDATPPVIALSAPAVDTTTDAAQITVSGTITDALVTDPQILGVTIDCTGANVAKTVYLNADGSFETTVPLVEGNNVINVVAVDGAVTATSGNQAVTTRTVTRTVTPLTTYAIILVVVALILAAIAIFRKEMK
jgi:hypothetical protein